MHDLNIRRSLRLQVLQHVIAILGRFGYDAPTNSTEAFMNTSFTIRLASALLAATPIFCLAGNATLGTSENDAAIANANANAPTSIAKVLPALSASLGSGVDKSCSPTHLTVVGKAKDGSRLYVSALVPQFAAELRKSAKGSAKLTRDQAHEIQRLVDYATQAQKNATGLPQEAIDQIASNTGMKIQATMICLSREQVSSK
jgi:hypothetical protein